MEYKKHTGMKRLFAALGNSIAGLKTAFKSEEAFRQEVFISIILFPLSFIIGQSTVEIILLISALFAVLITELLNTAVEFAIDRISKDYHEFSKAAKDIGSTAVLLAMLYFAIVWGMIIFDRFF